MKPVRLAGLGLFAILICAIAGVAGAQSRPNLSGEWVASEGVQRVTIESDSDVIEITEVVGSLEHHFIYDLNGAQSHNETRTVTGALWLHDAQARWVENAVLVTTRTTRTEVDSSWEWMKIYHLTSPDRLSVTLIDRPLGMPGAMVMLTTKFDRQ